ncbi:hypothetical protein FOZ62_010157, partial [Perkinsus olseni]
VSAIGEGTSLARPREKTRTTEATSLCWESSTILRTCSASFETVALCPTSQKP